MESTDQGTTWMRPDADVDVLLPRDRALRDFARRVSELLVTLGRVEERSELDVYRDLTMATADAIRIQVTGKGSEEGTIALDDGVSVIQHARNLLLAAACSVEPRPLHPTRKPARAAEYLHGVRLGQTERGSFVATLLSPVSPLLVPPIDGQLPVPVEVPDPFERRAVMMLMTALRVTHSLATKASVGVGALLDLEKAVAQGVSSNLCDALAGIGDEGERTFVVRASWSLTRPAAPQPPITFDDDVLPSISEAGRLLRETSPRPDATIVGQIVKLEQDEEDPGRATIAGVVDGETRRATVQLAESDRALAVSAYEARSTVSVTGELRREGRGYVLADVRDVRVVGDR